MIATLGESIVIISAVCLALIVTLWFDAPEG